jgi:aspartyl-tRNA(Asn)/glutamyl-tRNA(Gln) amidotransferase subunit C
MPAMSVTLSAHEVSRIAALARLALTADERVQMAVQLGQILAFAAEVASLDTGRVTPADDPLASPPLERADEVRPSIGESDALSNAPERADNLFLTPRVLPRE